MHGLLGLLSWSLIISNENRKKKEKGSGWSIPGNQSTWLCGIRALGAATCCWSYPFAHCPAVGGGQPSNLSDMRLRLTEKYFPWADSKNNTMPFSAFHCQNRAETSVVFLLAMILMVRLWVQLARSIAVASSVGAMVTQFVLTRPNCSNPTHICTYASSASGILGSDLSFSLTSNSWFNASKDLFATYPRGRSL